MRSGPEDVDDTETTEGEFDHAMASAFPANVYTSREEYIATTLVGSKVRVSDLLEPDRSPLPKTPERPPRRRNAVKPVAIRPRPKTPDQTPNA